MKALFVETRGTLTYALLLAVLLISLKWLEWNLLIRAHALDLYIGGIAVLFTSLGLWLAKQLAKPAKNRVSDDTLLPASLAVNGLAAQFGLTLREKEVLQQLLQGKSNAEIASHLFVSLSTIKTHTSNLFLKMDVKSRTQAMEKAVRYGFMETGVKTP